MRPCKHTRFIEDAANQGCCKYIQYQRSKDGIIVFSILVRYLSQKQKRCAYMKNHGNTYTEQVPAHYLKKRHFLISLPQSVYSYEQRARLA